MIRWFERRQVYAPSRVLEGDAGDLRRPFEDVWFSSATGAKLHGWFFPATNKSVRSQLALLLMHGNGGNISHRKLFYQAWLDLGLNVFTFDYQGYGLSEGRPGEEATYQDAQGALRWLETRGFPAGRVVAIGKSLGGGVASELALREPVGGLILQSTFSSIADLGSELFPWLPVRRMHSIRYDTASKLQRITAPVLVLHSRSDDLIGFHHAERNHNAARAPKMLWEIAGMHSNVLEVDRGGYLLGLEKFLVQHIDSSLAPGRS
jgi:uncharacterized protein